MRTRLALGVKATVPGQGPKPWNKCRCFSEARGLAGGGKRLSTLDLEQVRLPWPQRPSHAPRPAPHLRGALWQGRGSVLPGGALQADPAPRVPDRGEGGGSRRSGSAVPRMPSRLPGAHSRTPRPPLLLFLKRPCTYLPARSCSSPVPSHPPAGPERAPEDRLEAPWAATFVLHSRTTSRCPQHTPNHPPVGPRIRGRPSLPRHPKAAQSGCAGSNGPSQRSGKT